MSLHNTCLTVVPDNLGCRALSLVQTKGYTLGNGDATIIAPAPQM